MKALQHRQEELELKELQLGESLVKFDRFLKENDARRKQSLKKAVEEMVIIKSKDREFGMLSAELIKCKDKNAKLAKTISKLHHYEKYLRNVLTVTTDFPEVLPHI